jgi:hypothetical protein
VGGARCEGSSAARESKLSGLTLLCTSILSMPAMLCACWGAATCVGRVLYAGGLGCLCCLLLAACCLFGCLVSAAATRNAERAEVEVQRRWIQKLQTAASEAVDGRTCRDRDRMAIERRESGAGGIAESNVTAGCGIRGCCSARRVVVRDEGSEAEHVEAGKESDNTRSRTRQHQAWPKDMSLTWLTGPSRLHVALTPNARGAGADGG